jgi:hypothetical protein
LPRDYADERSLVRLMLSSAWVVVLGGTTRLQRCGP